MKYGPYKRKQNGTHNIRFKRKTFSQVVVMRIDQCYLQLKRGTGDPAVAAKHLSPAQDMHQPERVRQTYPQPTVQYQDCIPYLLAEIHGCVACREV